MPLSDAPYSNDIIKMSPDPQHIKIQHNDTQYDDIQHNNL